MLVGNTLEGGVRRGIRGEREGVDRERGIKKAAHTRHRESQSERPR